MHIPDGFLSNDVAAVAAVPAVAAVAYGLRRASSSLDEKRVPLLGVTAAFIFAVQMLNFPVAGGTSGHLLGAALAAILLGPWLACVVMAVVLTAQCFVFADGGVTALGANDLNMGVIGALVVGFGVVWALKVLPPGRATYLATAGVGAWMAVMLGATRLRDRARRLGHRALRHRAAGHARRPRADRHRRGRDHGRRRQRGAGRAAGPAGGRPARGPPLAPAPAGGV